MNRYLSITRIMNAALSFALIFCCSFAFADEELDYEKLAQEIQEKIEKAMEKVEEIDFDELMENAQHAIEEGVKHLEEIDLDQLMEQVERNLKEGFKNVKEIDRKEMFDSIQKRVEQAMKHAEERMKHVEKRMKDAEKKLSKRLADLDHKIHTNRPMISFQSFEEIKKKFKGKLLNKKTEKTFAVKEGAELSAHCSFSSIHITPGKESGKVHVSVEQIAGGDTEEIAQEILDSMHISLTQTKNTVSIQIEMDNNSKKDDGRRRKKTTTTMKNIVRVEVPVNTSIGIKNSFGDVIVKDVHGILDCNTSFGNTHLSGTKDDLIAINKYGNLEITQHDGKGKINIQFCNLNIDGWNGPLDLNTSYGKTWIKGLTSNAILHNQNSFGEITVELPNDFSGKVEAVSSFGEIDAPKGIETKKKGMFNKLAEGTLGQGDGHIQIKSSYSPVKIVMEHQFR